MNYDASSHYVELDFGIRGILKVLETTMKYNAEAPLPNFDDVLLLVSFLDVIKDQLLSAGHVAPEDAYGPHPRVASHVRPCL